VGISDDIAAVNPDALLADGLEDALVGWTVNHHRLGVAIYDAEKCVQILVARNGISREEAEEYLEFNTYGAFVGEEGPIFARFPND